MTTIERDNLIAQLFSEAGELPPEKRDDYLAQKCAGDSALLAELKALLAAHDQVRNDGFLQRPAIEDEATASFFVHTDRNGQTAGRYRFIKLIGEGGMGEVYRAEDTELQRTVAVKLIRSALKTGEILRRFNNERQILAQLNHDNIARLFDAGTTDDGVPFLAMEYIDGEPIDLYCDRKKLSVDERLKLFRTICSAVQYAHQRLIVHRDLKPSNVLVNEQGQPKLLDFGIAKLLDSATENDATATLLRVMTPEYASPEQVKGETITTATDVYQLGVLLYELLTGVRPYKLTKRSTDEVIRAICEQEPTRPSHARLGIPTSVGPSLEEKSPAEAGNLTPVINPKSLQGDIDNIILKALRKDPARRYQSVADLSEDIRRYLAGEPVTARKDTFSYRAVKFVKRNRVAVGATAAVVLVLIVGTVTTAYEAHKARAERAIAEERFNQVRQIAHQVMFDYHDAIAVLPGSTKVREQMVNDSLTYLDKLAQQAGDDRNLQREIASAYFKVGDAQGRPFYANLGDSKGANESYRKSLAIREKLAALEPGNAELRAELGASYERLGRLNIALGNPAVAVENLQKAMTIYEELLRTDPTNRPIRGELGLVNTSMGIAVGFSGVGSLGDRKAALEYQRKAVAILEPLTAEEPTNLSYREYLGGCYLFIGSLYQDDGHLTEALENYRKALSNDQPLMQENPANNYLQREVAVDYSDICNVLRNMGDNDGSLDNGRQALAIFEKMATADPNDANIAKDLATMNQNLGVTLTRMKDYPAASEHYRTAVRILEDFGTKNPADADLQMRMAWGYYRLSDAQSLSGDLAHAIENAEHGRGVLESLIATNPKNSTAAKYLAVVYSQLGKCETLEAKAAAITSNQRVDDWRSARDWYQKSLDIYQDMKSKGTLSGADAGKPDELSGEISKCVEALKKLGTS